MSEAVMLAIISAVVAAITALTTIVVTVIGAVALWLKIQEATLEAKKASDLADLSRKEAATKISEVHTLVDGQKTALDAKIVALQQEVTWLKNMLMEKEKSQVHPVSQSVLPSSVDLKIPDVQLLISEPKKDAPIVPNP